MMLWLKNQWELSQHVPNSQGMFPAFFESMPQIIQAVLEAKWGPRIRYTYLVWGPFFASNVATECTYTFEEEPYILIKR